MDIAMQNINKSDLSDNNNNQQLLGGDGIIIAIDWLHFYIQKKIHHLIVMVEIKDIPPRFKFFTVDPELPDLNILPVVMNNTATGSWIFMEDKIIDSEMLKILKDNYPIVVARSQVEKHNTNHQNVFDMLVTIWTYVIKHLQPLI